MPDPVIVSTHSPFGDAVFRNFRMSARLCYGRRMTERYLIFTNWTAGREGEVVSALKMFVASAADASSFLATDGPNWSEGSIASILDTHENDWYFTTRVGGSWKASEGSAALPAVATEASAEAAVAAQPLPQAAAPE